MFLSVQTLLNRFCRFVCKFVPNMVLQDGAMVTEKYVKIQEVSLHYYYYSNNAKDDSFFFSFSEKFKTTLESSTLKVIKVIQKPFLVHCYSP